MYLKTAIVMQNSCFQLVIGAKEITVLGKLFGFELSVYG